MPRRLTVITTRTLFWSVLALLTCGRTAVAQTDEEDLRRATARALFQDGVRLTDEGQLEDAEDRFRRAYDHVSSPNIAANLGVVLQKLGRFVEASEWAHRALDAGDASPEVRVMAQGILDVSREQIGRLTIRLMGPRDGVDVELNERRLLPTALGVPIPANPGPQRAVALRKGDIVAEQRTTLDPAGAAVLDLTIPVMAPAPAAPPQAATPPHETWWFWTGVGVIVAASTVAVVLASQGSDTFASMGSGAMTSPLY
ncbi:MAG: tetratricopeptide repeat protein [Myxococcales bacterium]|nr:tetratricopeptide repeat protein [Myxococcales bacterium]